MIEGVLNFREVTGVCTMEGKKIRPEKLFRSGSFDNISAAGIQKLQDLGIAEVFDLRSSRERELFPFTALIDAGISVAGPNHANKLGDLTTTLQIPSSKPEDVEQAMISICRKIPYLFAPVYRELFSGFIQRDGAFTINCAVGKDRTGVAIALLLSALGVGFEDIVTEYEKTNKNSEQIRINLRGRTRGQKYSHLPDEVTAPVFRADRKYLAAMYDAIYQKDGSVAEYLSVSLNIGKPEIEELRRLFLQPG